MKNSSSRWNLLLRNVCGVLHTQKEWFPTCGPPPQGGKGDYHNEINIEKYIIRWLKETLFQIWIRITYLCICDL
jgi:hypothetical protein